MDAGSSGGLVKRGAHFVLRLRVQPGASREGVIGLSGDRIRIGVHAPAREGAANRALLRFLSRSLRVSRSCLSIVSGRRNRDKDVLVDADIAEREILSRIGIPQNGRAIPSAGD